MALDFDAQKSAFPDATTYNQYTATGVVTKNHVGIYNEVCLSKSDSTASLPTVNEWMQLAPATCGRYLKVPENVQTLWLTALELNTLDETAADFVKACTGDEDSMLVAVDDKVMEIVVARNNAAKPSTTATAAAPVSSGTTVSTWTDSTGRSVRITIRLSSGVRATDSAQVDSLWHAAGGPPPTACFANRSSGAVDSDHSDIHTARVWVGAVTYENLTPKYGWAIPSVYWNAKPDTISLGIGFGNGSQCVRAWAANTAVDPGGSTATRINLPIIVVQASAFTPNSPNGVAPPVVAIDIPGLTGAAPQLTLAP